MYATNCHNQRVEGYGKDFGNGSDPIFVMKNGYGDMVLMSLETLENMFQRQKLYRELDISERQIKDGKTRGAREALADVREKYGL